VLYCAQVMLLFNSYTYQADNGVVLSFIREAQTPRTLGPCASLSVIVPMTYNRLDRYGPRLLESIANNTRLPCQLIFSVSSAPKEKLDFNRYTTELNASSVNITMLITSEHKTAAENRNRGATQGQMPVFAFLDSDDIAGPQWIETLEHVFESYHADAFLNKWFACRDPKSPIPQYPIVPRRSELMLINDVHPKNLTDEQLLRWACCPTEVPPGFHNRSVVLFDESVTHSYWAAGHIAVKREVWDTIKQVEGPAGRGKEDSVFVRDILKAGYKTLLTKNKLTGYCKF
jgi:hypothetical protein